MRDDFRGYDRGGEPVAPVQVGEELDVKIEAVGEKGDGIARKKGFILFVPNTVEGEEVRIKVNKVLRKVGFADKLGPASGPLEASAKPTYEKRPSIEEFVQPAEPSPDDSEDFGEELVEDDSVSNDGMTLDHLDDSQKEPSAPEPVSEDKPEESLDDLDDLDVPPPPSVEEEEKKE